MGEWQRQELASALDALSCGPLEMALLPRASPLSRLARKSFSLGRPFAAASALDRFSSVTKTKSGRAASLSGRSKASASRAHPWASRASFAPYGLLQKSKSLITTLHDRVFPMGPRYARKMDWAVALSNVRKCSPPSLAVLRFPITANTNSFPIGG